MIKDIYVCVCVYMYIYTHIYIKYFKIFEQVAFRKKKEQNEFIESSKIGI